MNLCRCYFSIDAHLQRTFPFVLLVLASSVIIVSVYFGNNNLFAFPIYVQEPD